jgi:catechol 2,3-dioxygenase-like lactoylglutathione lyase family enzyme
LPDDETVNVRYMVDDVDDAIAFYTKVLGAVRPRHRAFYRAFRRDVRCSGMKPSGGVTGQDGATTSRLRWPGWEWLLTSAWYWTRSPGRYPFRAMK